MKILTMPLCSDLINVLTSLRDEQGRQSNVAILTLEDSEFRLLELFIFLMMSKSRELIKSINWHHDIFENTLDEKIPDPSLGINQGGNTS